MAVRTRPIVRPDIPNRMVTKGYQKGVYDRITKGTCWGTVGRHDLPPCRDKRREGRGSRSRPDPDRLIAILREVAGREAPPRSRRNPFPVSNNSLAASQRILQPLHRQALIGSD